MEDSIVKVNGINTRVLTWGGKIGENKQLNSKDLIICIPGNPGVTYFYIKFLQTLFEKLGFPIWIVGHAGHDYIEEKVNESNNPVNYYTLAGQVQHKIDFLRQFAPKDVRIHLIGHSIGSYIILELLKHPDLKKNVVKCYLMFPTIEHMAVTPNGKFLLYFTPFINFIKFATWFFSILPLFIQSFLLFIYMTITDVHSYQKNALLKFLHPFVVSNVLCMGKDEMDFVNERNDESLKENKGLLKLYYSTSDGWTPLTYYEQIKKDHPGLDVELCSNNYEHAFVLRQSVEVAGMISNWILN